MNELGERPVTHRIPGGRRSAVRGALVAFFAGAFVAALERLQDATPMRLVKPTKPADDAPPTPEEPNQ